MLAGQLWETIKMKLTSLPRKLFTIVNLSLGSILGKVNCYPLSSHYNCNCKLFWILLVICKCLVSTSVVSTSTSFTWSLEEDKRFYLPTNYYPIYRNPRSHGVSLSSSSSHLLSSSSFANYHHLPPPPPASSSSHVARFDDTTVDAEDETNYDDNSNGADDINDDDGENNSGNSGDINVINDENDEDNTDNSGMMMMVNEGTGIDEIENLDHSRIESDLIILSRGRGLPKSMSHENQLLYIDRITKGDWCRIHGHSASSSPPLTSLPISIPSPTSSLKPSSLYEINSNNQVTFGKLQMPSGSSSSSSSSSSSIPKSPASSIPSPPHPSLYASSPSHEIPPHSLRLRYNQTAARVDLLNAILHDYKPQNDNYRLMKKSFHHMIDLDKDIIHARIIWLSDLITNGDNLKQQSTTSSSTPPEILTNIQPAYYYTAKRKRIYTLNINRTISPYEPWFDFQFGSKELEKLFDQLLSRQFILRSQLSSFQQPIDLNSFNDNPQSSTTSNNLTSHQSSTSTVGNGYHKNKKEKISTSTTKNPKTSGNNKTKSSPSNNINSNNKNDPNNNNDHSNNNNVNKCPKFTSWTNAYYSCDYKIWLFSYTSLIILETADSCTLRGIISVDIDINSIDVNQCDHEPSSSPSSSSSSSSSPMTMIETMSTLTTKPSLTSTTQPISSSTLISTTLPPPVLTTQSSVTTLSSSQSSLPTINLITIPLIGTHKCHKSSSKCFFHRGHGWTKGGYECRCRDGYYAPSASFLKKESNASESFNGTQVEKAWNEKITNQGSVQYDMIFVCQKCQPGCDTCKDNSPCLSSYNWAFRISLLTFSAICIFLTTLLACYIYKYRKLKVFKVASPIFLCITLLGCAIMYLEMAAIFPVLTTAACIATKTTRHMGFCLTYSALLLKTWRVSLTYRVKSAHKLKLTDKQLLQWLFPILMIMAIYLGTWTISAPPQSIYIYDWNNLKFKICEYNWWDHSLAIMESCFLLWGVKVCYNVRNAESFFNEAKYICWAIYNISAVNVTMICIHLILLPKAGPDGKYFFGFVRTQLSTTTTIAFIFGPKFYRVIKGQGDSWDNRVRARGINASFSLNGVGLVHEEAHDLYQENEELKEEIHKLATQIELMKLMQMEINNRHLKPKHPLASGHHHILPTVTITANPASTGSVTQSPMVKACYSRFDGNTEHVPSPRISPAEELASERV